MATYKVKKGDDYNKIAEKYKLPTSQLVRTNRSVPLSAGQTIKIPTPFEKVTRALSQISTAFNSAFPNQNYGGRANAGTFQFQTPAQGSFVSGGGGLNTIQNPNINNINSQPIANQGFKTPMQGSFVSGGGLVPPTTTQQAYLSQFPGQGTIGGVVGQVGAAARLNGVSSGVTTLAKNNQNKAANAFPGFWGGGKNGGFYKTLREAKIATRRHKQSQDGGDSAPTVTVYTPPAPTVLGDRTDAVNWKVG